MNKIDTSQWGTFSVGDLVDKLDLKFLPERSFNKAMDVSEYPSDEFNLPLVNAKHSNNGIMYYGRQNEWQHATMTIDIVGDGAASTGDVYAQPQETGVLYNAYLVKPKEDVSENVLFYLATVIQRCIKDRFGYDNKCTWDKVKIEKVKLPIDSLGAPDWAYMDSFMQNVMNESKACLGNLRLAKEEKSKVDISKWKDYEIGKLFDIVKPPVLHARQVTEDDSGIPYVVRTKFDNGIKFRVMKTEDMSPSPKGVISFGSENAMFFYQSEEFVSGRDIYYLDTQGISERACQFLAACMQPIARKYSYNYGLFPELLKLEHIKLPADSDGKPDWAYMDSFMADVFIKAKDSIHDLKEVTL
ncbi:MAG: restriction endonuclease subunit S [Scardovia wiggsiae]|uniref:restriction endonuclease subunit S n=1 Tax=Scardovia wiggsiae TaxID=230143 RepID=UPI001CAF3540|nr:restriction endonuclease subunit S [Scardovia wiggsiae]